MKKLKDYSGNAVYLFEYPYTTVNGEGKHIGMPAVFIRFQGCTVGCVWCDAMGTWPKKKGDKYIGIRLTNKQLTDYLDAECKNFTFASKVTPLISLLSCGCNYP